MPNFTLLKSVFLLGFVLVLCFILNYEAKAQNTQGSKYTISRFDYAFCSAPNTNSAFVQASFSITETSTGPNEGFVKDQTNRPFILTLDAGFKFNPAPANASITTTGTAAELKIEGYSFSADSSSLTVRLTTGGQNVAKSQNNTLLFNNFEIRATGSHNSGSLRRNGGTFEIDNSTSRPLSTEPFANFTRITPFVYQSNAVIQTRIDSVTQYSIDNQILRINISGTGECGTSLRNIVFSTEGTELPSNITNAKLYSTGNSNVFANANYFGEVIISPNGQFVISGVNNLVNGDNYFWLTYDIHGDASTATGQNKLDAQAISFTIREGSTDRTIAFTNGNPTGNRTIKAAEYYFSRYSGTWESSDMWSETLGGPSSGKIPNGQGVVVISTGHSVSLSTNRTIDVIEIRDNALLTINNPLTVGITLKTIGSGRFTTNSALTVNGHLELTGTGISNSSNSISVGGVMNIGAGATLSKTNNHLITINGNLIINGQLNQTTGADISVMGGATEISGTGTITARTLISSTSDKMIPASADLKIYANVTLGTSNARRITNRGRVLISGTLNGGHADSRWINEENSTLIYQGATRMFTTGILEANAANNTINYNGGNQDIISPTLGQYCHLILSGSGTKNHLDNILRVSGNFTNNATFNPGTAGSTKIVVFNGTSAQTISGTTVTRFEEIGIDNTSGITLGNNIEVSGKLTFNNGFITTNSSVVIIASTATVSGAGTGKFVNGNLRKAFTSANQLRTFEVGSNGDYTPVDITFSTLGTAGSLTVRSNNGDHALINSSCINPARSVNKNWTITNAGSATATAGTYSATFTFALTNFDVGAIQTSFRVARYSATSDPVWTTQTVGSANLTSTQATGITTFGDFQVGELGTTPTAVISANPSATACIGQTITFNATTTLAGSTPSFQWQTSPDGTNWTNVGTNSTTYATNSLSNNTRVRVLVTPGGGTCGSTAQFSSNTITVTINPLPTISLNSVASVCIGSNSFGLPYAGTTNSPTTYSITAGVSGAMPNFVAVDNNSLPASPISVAIPTSTAAGTYNFILTVRNANGCTSQEYPFTATINPATVAGAVSGAATVCSGTNSTTLTLSGHTGSVVRWESSTNNFSTVTTIANTTTTLTATNLTATTQYRAVVRSGACSEATTAAITITVDPATVAGTVSGAATVCSGTNSTTLTLSGHTGSVLRWESSTDNFSTVATIANTTTTLTATNLTATTQYRAVVRSGVCAELNSSPVTVTVNPIPATPTASNGGTICAGGTLTLSTPEVTGATYSWTGPNGFSSTLREPSIPNATAAATGTYLVTITVNGCASAAGSTDATVNAPGTWLGITSNWHDANNWCGGVPGENTNVVITANAANMPIINAAGAICNDLLIDNTYGVSGLTLQGNHGLELKGDFENFGNFVMDTGTLRFTGSTKQTFGSNSALTVGSFVVNNPTGVSLNTQVTIGGQLTLQTGNLDLNNNLLILGSNATMSPGSANSYIVAQGGGFVQVPVKLNVSISIPIGTTSAYSPMTFNLKRATLTGGEYIQANVDTAASASTYKGHPRLNYQAENEKIYLKRYWRLTPDQSISSGLASNKDFAYDVRFDYLDGDIINPSGKPEGLITLGKYSNSTVEGAGTWQAGGARIDTTNNILSATNVSSFSSFTGAQMEMYDQPSPLPITLLYFTARPTGEEVELTWATAMEENNHFFTVERSVDGKDYAPVLEKNGAGNSNRQINYKAFDQHPIHGLSYYRLKQTDFDGTFTYSAAVAVNYNGGKSTELIAYPNPNNGQAVDLIVRGLNGQKATVKVTDLLGKVIYTQKVDITDNSQVLQIDFASKLSAGTYTIQVSSNQATLTKKLIVI